MFISDKFVFNGIHSDDMGVSLVTFDNNLFNTYGLSYNKEISLNKSGIDMSHFIEGEGTIEEVELNLALVDKDNNPLEWDNYSIMEITNWLITDSFVEFISEDNIDLVYYFKTKKIVKNFTRDKLGYLQVIFQPFSNLGYIKYDKDFSISNNGDFSITSPSSFKEYIPIITIKNLGDNLDIITLENEKFPNEVFEISNLDNNEVVTIDGLLGTVYNEYGDNLLMNCNRNWLQLTNGRNKIKVKGNIDINVKCQFPVRV